MPFDELCQRREKDHQVTLHSSLSHFSFWSLSLCFFFLCLFFFFFFFFFEPPRHLLWWLHHGRRQGLHGLILCFFSHPFILLGYANASSMCFCFVLCLLPTPETPQCLFPRHRHYLSLSHGSVGVLPSPFALGPFVGGVRSLFHLCYFSFFLFFLHLCATIAPWLPRAAGPCTSGATSTCHPLWWFLLFSTRGDLGFSTLLRNHGLGQVALT